MGGREGGKETFTGMGARLDVGGGEEDGASMKHHVLHFSTTTRRGRAISTITHDSQGTAEHVKV